MAESLETVPWGLPGQLVPGSPQAGDDSPSKKARVDIEDPDMQLDQMLKQRQVHNQQPASSRELAPAWLHELQVSIQASLKTSIDSNFVEVKQFMGDFNARISAVEAKLTEPPVDPRVDQLSAQVEALTKLVHGNRPEQPGGAPGAFQPAAPFDPWASFQQPRRENTQQKPKGEQTGQPDHDTDFCHIVVGGWGFDTPKRVIQTDLDRLLQTFDDETRSCLHRQVIYGQRAQTAHLYMSHLEHALAADRFYQIQQAYSRKISTTDGSAIWLGPSRTLDRRLKNKATRQAKDAMDTLWRANAAPDFEIGWAKQIIWLEDCRVCASTKESLYAKPDHRIITRTLGDKKDPQRFFFNLTTLGQKANLSDADAEVRLQDFA